MSPFDSWIVITFGAMPTTLTKTLRALHACYRAHQAVMAIDQDGSPWSIGLAGERWESHRLVEVMIRRASEELVKAGYLGERGGLVLADVKRLAD